MVSYSLTDWVDYYGIDGVFLLRADKLASALPDAEELAKLMPDLEKIGENFTFLKGLLSTGML